MIIQIAEHHIDIGAPSVGNSHDIAVQELLAKLHQLYKDRVKDRTYSVSVILKSIAYHVLEKKKAKNELRRKEAKKRALEFEKNNKKI